ncbi:MAG: ATP-dependent RecD-like DNA helicase [bacterium]|nr:ATP-dependent RecD-like DNA helicase [bacterium]
MTSLSTDQQKAITALRVWVSSEDKKDQYITLGGFAGTGKTTLIAILRKLLYKDNEKLKVGFASYTGKAARVLRTKLLEQKALSKKDSVGTIHSLIYSPVVNGKQEIIGWKRKDKLDRNLIIIDEASMVDGDIWEHLLKYKIPIIAVGDHGQLPPIRGSFNLMEKPHIVLEQIHRQAAENPIIGLSIQAREQGYVRQGIYSKNIKKYTSEDPDYQLEMNEVLETFTPETLILCGYNHTRKRLNNHIRLSQGRETEEPTRGDRVICLRNNHEKGIANGMLGTITNISTKDTNWYEAEIAMDGEEELYTGLISSKQFSNDTALNFTDKRSRIMAGDLFDFGYALTVHKAQGSQAKRVILFEERFAKMNDYDWKRWLYTAITRAEEDLIIFGK